MDSVADITSVQNPKIKKLLALQQKSSERRESGLFVVEGRREIEHCAAVGYEIDSVFCLDGNLDFKADRVFRVTPEVYGKIAYREGTVLVSSYVPRHSWATAARNNGADVSTISDAIGHRSERTTIIYLACFDRRKIEKVNKRLVDHLKMFSSL